MRRSVPMPLRTRLTSAPTASHSCAIWFMNEIRVASIAFAAYLVISADRVSMKMSGLPVRTNGAYSSSRTVAASSESTPTTTRSGFMKSSTAAPSLRNSGFEHTWNAVWVWRAISTRTRSAVPTGTVLLVMTIFGARKFSPMVRATASTWRRSADPSSSGGVPTAMNTTSARRTASPTSAVNCSRPSRWLRDTRGSSPGS